MLGMESKYIESDGANQWNNKCKVNCWEINFFDASDLRESAFLVVFSVI